VGGKVKRSADAATNVTWRELVALVGVPSKDARVVDILARLGRAAPKSGATVIHAKPHGVAIELVDRRVSKVTITLDDHDDDVGMWKGEISADIPRGITEAAAEALGAHNDKLGCLTFPVSNGVQTVLEFDSDDKLYRVHSSVPEA
jgi:hypothetical protein